ncbi:MAG: uroporphyrin-III C-methyltransferase [Myxococcaceae bacterium]|nr:uroporphyrin-III C-methyltransferase [Myxococcaceae bacterium]
MSGLDFPIALRLQDRAVLLVGAGKIATGRLAQLLEAGAKVHVVAPEVSPEIVRLAAEGKVRLSQRGFEPSDCEGAWVIFSATDQPEVTQQVVAEARRRGVLVNAADLPGLCDFYVPSFGRRGPVTVAVSTAGLAPGLSRTLKDRALDAVGPEWGKLARLLGRLRRITPPGPARTKALSAIVDGGAAQLLARGDRPLLWKRIRAVWPRSGIVYLVGAGPGDPGLLTLRGAELLGRADAVVYDRLIHPEILARARKGARLVFVGKEGGGEQTSQDEINAVLIAQARLGRRVVRLKGGDPFVFGRGGEEAIALSEAGIAFEVVPGVSSGIAAPAAAGIPVTHRAVASSVTFATGHRAEDNPNWKHLAGAQTLVLFMAGRKLAEATAALVRQGKSARTPAAIVEAGTWEGQRVIEGTLGEIAELAAAAQVGSPALLVVGEVVRLRAQLTALAQQASARSGAGR